MKGLIILLSFWSCVVGNGHKLPVCSKSRNVSFRRLCKISVKYPTYPFIVQPKITIGEVLDIDEMEKSMTVSMETMLLWNDSLVSVEGNITNTNGSVWLKIDGDDHSELYWPKIKFINQRETKRLQLYGDEKSKFQYFWFKPPHYFEYAEYHVVTIGCNFNSNSYPFDHLECSVTFFNPELTDELFIWKPVSLSIKDQSLNQSKVEATIPKNGLPFDISVQALDSSKTSSLGYEYNTAGLLIKFKRNNAWTLITGYFGPTALYSLLSTLSFVIKKSQIAGRMGMLVTLFLISTNSYNSVDAPEDRGVSFIEIWMLGTHLPLLFALVEYGIILGMDKMSTKTCNAKKWDIISLIFVICYHLVFQLSFWLFAYFNQSK